MFKKKYLLLLFTGFLVITIFLSQIQSSFNSLDLNYENQETPRISADLEGAENILITEIDRLANVSGYGLLHIEDSLTVKNLNNNPITAIYVGIPYSDDLVFYDATNKDRSTLVAERSYMVMDGFEMIAIYFDSPLLPQEAKTVIFRHSYKDIIDFIKVGTQQIIFTGYVFPILPYKAEGEIVSIFSVPKSSSVLQKDVWANDKGGGLIEYKFDNVPITKSDGYIKPFLENLIDNGEEEITLILSDNTITKMEISTLTREIYISPWNVIKVKEHYILENLGIVDIATFTLKIPGHSRGIKVSDDLGELLGVETDPSVNYSHLEYKDLIINLIENRVRVKPNSRVRFNVEYILPFYNYTSLNWLQETVEIDLFTTVSEFLTRFQTVKIIIDGCYKIDSITHLPDSIENSNRGTILIYEYDNVIPMVRRVIQFTFTIDILDMLFRPIVFILLIAIILSAYVFIVKTKKAEEDTSVIKKETLPVNEIREFCSLYEEKTALFLEIRQAEADAKRKKIAKKKYRNILAKNAAKIEEIENEIVPFKKIVRETNDTFENILKKLDVLEAETVSVKDSLNLLETRYKRGRLPSRAAYIKLSDQFLRRRRKIDRTTDKLIQQLRSYLL